MGEMADDALEFATITEDQRYNYHNDFYNMEEAFDLGILDTMGVESPDCAIRNADTLICTESSLDNEISHMVKNIDLAQMNKNLKEAQKVSPVPNLDRVAIENLSKSSPTCNYCERAMTARSGKFGKFYFCSNGCEKQNTVSDKYWQSVRKI